MKKIYSILILTSLVALPAAAQQISSAYFMEGYKFRHQVNPAFASSRSYFNLPVMGNTHVATSSNMGISTFLYPHNGQLTTFMNGAVSADEFMSKLNKNNLLGVDASVNLLSVGAWGKKGFTFFEMGIKSSSSVNLPKDLFAFMKNVGQAENYDISNLGLRTRNYFELALGHSFNINRRLNFGAKIKFLVGIASVDARISNLNVQMNRDKWSVTGTGTASIAGPGITLGTKEGTNELDYNSIGFFENLDGNIGSMISQITKGLGYGGAIDLGASYRVIDGLTLSVALLDLGFISWGNVINARTSDNAWTFDGFDDIAVTTAEDGTEKENSINNQLTAIGEDFKEFIVLYKDSETSKKLEMMTATLNVGAEYEMPFYDRLSVGFLYTNRFAKYYSKYEGRLYARIHPVKFFEFSTNYGISNYGHTWGAAMSFDFPGVGIFLATDNIFLNVTPPLSGVGIGVPYKKLNVSLNFGITFNLSKIRKLGDHRK